MRTTTRNRILGSRTAKHIMDVHGACMHLDILFSVACFL